MRKKGFTFVEAMMVTIIAVVVMFVIQAVFSHAVKSSLKGQDNLETMRAASRIFSELRKDLLQFKSISTAVDAAEVYVGEKRIPESIVYSSIIQIEKNDEVVVYSLCDGQSGKKYIERASQKIGAKVAKTTFGVPRMKAFEILYLKIENDSLMGLERTGQIIVNLVIQSDNPRFPSKKLSVSSSYFPEKLQDTDWNYLAL